MEVEISGSKNATADSGGTRLVTDRKNRRRIEYFADARSFVEANKYGGLAFNGREIRKRLNKSEKNNCANSALEYYNENNPGGEFELLKVTRSNCFTKGRYILWFHLNFLAKPRNASSDSSPKLFFAEVCDEFKSGPFRRCSIVDPSNSSETKPGCGYCNPKWKDGAKVYHPVGGFLRGRNRRYRPPMF